MQTEVHVNIKAGSRTISQLNHSKAAESTWMKIRFPLSQKSRGHFVFLLTSFECLESFFLMGIIYGSDTMILDPGKGSSSQRPAYSCPTVALVDWNV